MEERRICKRCLLGVEVPENVAVYLDKFLSVIPDGERTPEEIYEKRLAVCRSCDFLVGATCNACGCYVEMRAAVAEQQCPYRKWEGCHAGNQKK